MSNHNGGSDFAPHEMQQALESGLEAKNYYAWLTDTFTPHLRGLVLEHGAGSGTLSSALLGAGVGPLVLSEPDDSLASGLATKFAANSKVRVFRGTVDDYLSHAGGESVDAIVSSNVLEHVPDDQGCLTVMRKLLRNGGRLVLYVPARPELYGPFDRVVGHCRRYRRSDLRQKLETAGFRIDRLEYRNLLAALAWLWSVKIRKSEYIGGGDVKTYDRYIFPIVRRVEDIVPPLYGLNLLAIAH
jgi:SAM-dependent methyltransferase